MPIELIIEPNTPPMTWKQFCEYAPPFSISIDGFVNEGPVTGDSSPRLNLNHHEGVDRLTTRATCAQALILIRQGLLNVFRDEHGKPNARIYVNDCDQDVCATWFLFKHCYMTRFSTNPILNRFIYMADMLDTTAGAYPFPKDLPSLGQLAWVFEPYNRFRLDGGINRRDPEEFRSVITDVELRIMAHITNKGSSIDLDTRYERIGGGDGWVMVKEVGLHAFTGIASDGINAFISVRDRADGKKNYTIFRSLPTIPFDVQRIIAACNGAEGNPADCWGGGNTIGGSPRMNGSSLDPQTVENIANANK